MQGYEESPFSNSAKPLLSWQLLNFTTGLKKKSSSWLFFSILITLLEHQATSPKSFQWPLNSKQWYWKYITKSLHQFLPKPPDQVKVISTDPVCTETLRYIFLQLQNLTSCLDKAGGGGKHSWQESVINTIKCFR